MYIKLTAVVSHRCFIFQIIVYRAVELVKLCLPCVKGAFGFYNNYELRIINYAFRASDKPQFMNLFKK